MPDDDFQKLSAIMDGDPDPDFICGWCRESYRGEPGDDPTVLCHDCAQRSMPVLFREIDRLRAKLALLRAAVDAAVKGCRCCFGEGVVEVGESTPTTKGDCPHCGGLRAALQESAK